MKVDLNLKDKIEEVKQAEVIKAKELFSTVKKMHKNHTLFEINIESGLIQNAIFDDLPIIEMSKEFKGYIRKKYKLTVKSDCVYIMALNKKNAIKIFKREYLND